MLHSHFQPYMSSGSLSTSLLQRTGFDLCPNSWNASQIRAQPSPPLLPEIFSDELSRPVCNPKTVQREAKCYYCKKPGHKIRTCRYKRRRDKLRKATTSPVENLKASVSIDLAESEALCCSFPHDAPNTDSDACVDEDIVPQHDPLSKNVSVIQNHYDDTCVKLMKSNWNSHVVKCFSVSWLFSLSWMRNPFCMERCKRELCWLLSFAWLAEMFSFFDHKYVADE